MQFNVLGAPTKDSPQGKIVKTKFMNFIYYRSVCTSKLIVDLKFYRPNWYLVSK